MASIYTDAEREQRYDILRRRKKYLTMGFNGIVIAEVVFAYFLGGSAGIGGMTGEVLDAFLMLAGPVLIILTAYLKKWKIAAVVCLAALISIMTGLSVNSGVTLVFGAALLPLCIIWEKLSQEEGFPLFRIEYRELQEREKAREKQTFYRAASAGVRNAAANPDDLSQMGDILSGNVSALPQAPRRDISQLAQPVVQTQEPHGSEMDEL